jgi:hypothetical protein
MFSRTVWFNIPGKQFLDLCRQGTYIYVDEPSGNVKLGAAKTVGEYRARALVEKKTVLNLLLAYA